MPSYAANQVRAKLEVVLGRLLDKREILQSEEMVINAWPNAIYEFIDLMARRGQLVDFAVIYYPVMHGLLRGASRVHDVKRLTGGLGAVYARMDFLLQNGYTQNELDHIVLLSEECTQSELEWGIHASISRNIRSAIYTYRTIINSRRDKRVPNVKRAELDKVDTTCKIKNAGKAMDKWRQRLTARKVENANNEKFE
jgi:hypothetical protein